MGQPPTEKAILYDYKQSLNNLFDIIDYVSIRNIKAKPSPEYVPENIEAMFKEGSESLSGNCPNASGAMFRLCLDLTAKWLLSNCTVTDISKKITKNTLSNKLIWLFDNNILPSDMKSFSKQIRLDGNDGAHYGTLTQEDAESLMEFTYLLLERVYTNPEKLRLAEERREERKSQSSK